MELPNDAVRFNFSLQLKEASDVTDSIQSVQSWSPYNRFNIDKIIQKTILKRLWIYFFFKS